MIFWGTKLLTNSIIIHDQAFEAFEQMKTIDKR